MSGLGYISPEKPQSCDMCGKVAELRPYGPNGECVCFKCGMKDKHSARVQMGMSLFGLSRSEAEDLATARSNAETRTIDEKGTT